MLNTVVRTLSGPVGRKIFGPMVMRERASIFMLHRLADPATDVHGHTREQVASAISALRQSGATFVSLRSLVEAWRSNSPVAPNAVAFTMDDGFADQATFVREVFAPLRCPVTIFAISGFLDGRLWPWDDQLGYAFRHSPLDRATLRIGDRQLEVSLESPSKREAELNRVRDFCKTIAHAHLYELVRDIGTQLEVTIPEKPPAEHRPMTWDEAREVESLGVDIGPHSVTHRLFSQLTAEEARNELITSWNRLKQELRNPLPVFAWPTGRHTDYGTKDIDIAREIGLKASVATDDNYAHLPPSANDAAYFGIKRFALPLDLTSVLRYGSWIERGRQFLPF